MTTNLDNLTPDQLRRVDAMLALWHNPAYYEDLTAEEAPYYTTNIGTAMDLLMHCSRVWEIAQEFEDSAEDECGPFYCSIWKGDGVTGTGEASTLPLSICAAVMAAEGLEVPDA